jgi:hypothetical protein
MVGLIGLLGCGSSGDDGGQTGGEAISAPGGGGGGGGATSVPAFKKVVVVYFENDDRDNALGFPFFQAFKKRGAFLSNYRGVTHPSEPNYIALVAGTLDFTGVPIGVGGDNQPAGGMINDDEQYDLPGKHLGDLLEAKNLDWKNYAEDYPGTSTQCFTDRQNSLPDGSKGNYVRRHTPFLSFTNVSGDVARCTKHIVNASTFPSDVANGTLPAFSFYTPNLVDDGHGTPTVGASTKRADQWFQKTFGPLLDDPKFSDVLLVATFDENSCNTVGADESDPEDEAKIKRCAGDQNVIYAALAGNGVKAGSSSSVVYNHYNLLKTIEAGFGLGNLGKTDAMTSTVPITGIWK